MVAGILISHDSQHGIVLTLIQSCTISASGMDGILALINCSYFRRLDSSKTQDE